MMTTHYETVYITDPNISEAKLGELNTKLSEIIKRRVAQAHIGEFLVRPYFQDRDIGEVVIDPDIRYLIGGPVVKDRLRAKRATRHVVIRHEGAVILDQKAAARPGLFHKLDPVAIGLSVLAGLQARPEAESINLDSDISLFQAGIRGGRILRAER